MYYEKKATNHLGLIKVAYIYFGTVAYIVCPF